MQRFIGSLVCFCTLSAVKGCDWVYENNCYEFIETEKTFLDAADECQNVYQANLVGPFA